jgi:hypothetical protein
VTVSAFLFFHCDGDGTVRRQANFLAFNISHQAQVDEMMVPLVPAFTAVGFRQLDPTIFHPIDGSEMYAVSADDFHMLFDFARVGHWSTSGNGQDQRAESPFVHSPSEAEQPPSPSAFCTETDLGNPLWYRRKPGSKKISSANSSGGLYGVQAGCNYQFAGSWVVGVQGDIAGANINGSVSDPLNGAGHPPLTGFSIGMKTDRIAIVTGRLGVTGWNNLALFYVKGGVASR